MMKLVEMYVCPCLNNRHNYQGGYGSIRRCVAAARTAFLARFAHVVGSAYRSSANVSRELCFRNAGTLRCPCCSILFSQLSSFAPSRLPEPTFKGPTSPSASPSIEPTSNQQCFRFVFEGNLHIGGVFAAWRVSWTEQNALLLKAVCSIMKMLLEDTEILNHFSDILNKFEMVRY